jgi:putative ABC transport system permease protein
MKAELYLTARYLAARPGPALALALALALSAALPFVSARLARDFERALTERARATPLLAGPAGSRFDLTLAALYFRPSRLAPVNQALAERLGAEPGLLAIGIETSHSARGLPIVGVAREYFEQRGLRAGSGRLPNWVGECVLGARAARRLGLAVGGRLVSDTDSLLDLAKPPALELSVTGVLASSGGPDDDVILADLETAWAISGLSHAHADPSAGLAPGQLLGKDQTGDLVLSGAFVPDAALSAENRPRFHRHGSAEDLPLTAVLLFPQDHKVATLIETRINSRGPEQIVRPSAVIEELLADVLRIKRLADWLALLLGATTLALALSIARLGLELRAEEARTLAKLGAGAGIGWRLHACYWGAILGVGGLLAAALSALAVLLLSDPTRLL